LESEATTNPPQAQTLEPKLARAMTVIETANMNGLESRQVACPSRCCHQIADMRLKISVTGNELLLPSHVVMHASKVTDYAVEDCDVRIPNKPRRRLDIGSFPYVAMLTKWGGLNPALRECKKCLSEMSLNAR
jgi:hypothetical protein